MKMADMKLCSNSEDEWTSGRHSTTVHVITYLCTV